MHAATQEAELQRISRESVLEPRLAGEPDAPPLPIYARWLHASQSLLGRHPALTVTLGYLFLTAVGMAYEALFFSHFDIQIFDFADPADFLLAAARKPLLLVFTAVSVVLIVRLSRKHQKWIKKYPRYAALSHWLKSKKWWRGAEPVCCIGIVVGYFVMLTATYADGSASRIIRGNKGRRVSIELISETSTGHPAASYILLGTTSRYLLLFNPANKGTEILPLNNVARLTPRPG
jgi:hypothetical protein